jgi:hypothetical protein
MLGSVLRPPDRRASSALELAGGTCCASAVADPLTIGELARRSGVATWALRHLLGDRPAP